MLRRGVLSEKMVHPVFGYYQTEIVKNALNKEFLYFFQVSLCRI